MSREKTLIKNLIVFMTGNFTSRVLQFILLPIYTHYLPTADYGYYDIVLMTTAIIIPIITLQISDAAYRYLLDSKSDKDISKIVSNSVLVVFYGILIFSALYMIFIQFAAISQALLILFYIVLTILFNVWQQLSRGLRQNAVYAVSGVIYTAVMLASNIIMILCMDMGIEALFYSNIFASIVVVVFIEVQLGILKMVKPFQRDRTTIKTLLQYSAPLLPNAISWWVISTSSRYMMNYYIGAEANGIFAVSFKFPLVLTMLNSIFYLAWQESAINEYRAADKDHYYSKMFNLYMRLQFTAILVLLPVTKWIITLTIDQSYAESWKYVPLLYTGTIFSAFSSFYGTGYLSSKDTKGAFTTTITGAALNVAICFAAMPLIGIHAASIANMAAYTLIWILRVYQTKKYFVINIEKQAFILLSLFLAAFITLYYINELAVEIALAILSILIFLYFNKYLVSAVVKVLKNKLLPILGGR